MGANGRTSRFVHLRPRLQAVAELIGRVHTVADIGCDHGRLCMALLQSGGVENAIAADISASSLKKARALAAHVGLAERMETRQGSGLAVLQPGEADAIAICGMGGRLIADILEEAAQPLMGAGVAVCQPMRGVEELRGYLFAAGYRILQERIVLDQGRFYQIFSLERGQEGAQPPGWPEGCFLAGAKSVGEPLFPAMVQHMLAQCELRLHMARGTAGEEALVRKREALLALLAGAH